MGYKRHLFFNLTITLFILGLSLQPVYAQKPIEIQIHLSDSSEQITFSKIKKQLLTQTNFKDSLLARKELLSVIFKLQGSGYLSASFDSVYSDASTIHAYLFLGSLYKLAYLGKGNAENTFLSGTPLRNSLESVLVFVLLLYS